VCETRRREWKGGKWNEHDLKKKGVISESQRKGLRFDAYFANVRASESHLGVELGRKKWVESG
jgi:hypothetical protein